MRKIDKLLSEYGESHRNETNKTIHWICVPLIFLSIVGLIASIPGSPLQSIAGTSIFFYMGRSGIVSGDILLCIAVTIVNCWHGSFWRDVPVDY